MPDVEALLPAVRNSLAHVPVDGGDFREASYGWISGDTLRAGDVLDALDIASGIELASKPEVVSPTAFRVLLLYTRDREDMLNTPLRLETPGSVWGLTGVPRAVQEGPFAEFTGELLSFVPELESAVDPLERGLRKAQQWTVGTDVSDVGESVEEAGTRLERSGPSALVPVGLAVVAAAAFAFTDAGQELLQAIIPGEGGG